MTRNRQQRAARQARIRRFLQQPRPWPVCRMPPPVYAPPRADVMVFEPEAFAQFAQHADRFSEYADRIVAFGIRIRT